MTPSEWADLWAEFGFDRERPEAPYHYRSSIQLRIALRLWENHTGQPQETIDDAIGESLMLVQDSNDQTIGYDLHPGVNRRG